jgi:hypothetical protein
VQIKQLKHILFFFKTTSEKIAGHTLIEKGSNIQQIKQKHSRCRDSLTLPQQKQSAKPPKHRQANTAKHAVENKQRA